jgi:hypothetical protein
MEDAVVTNLSFRKCSVSAEECAAEMANGLASNKSVACIDVSSPRDGTLYNALAMALPSNSTLRDLSFLCGSHISAEHLPPVLLALGKNEGLKTLKLDVHRSMQESLCTALKDGLGMNEALESLTFNCYAPLRDENCALLNTAFSFLRTNITLKSLVVNVQHYLTTSCRSTFCCDLAAMLQDNASLESLTVQSCHTIRMKADEGILLLTALQHNKVLKTLTMYHNGFLALTHVGAGDVGSILRLNEAGRRYLIEDGSSISKGVKVLIAVSNEINCLFLHLLENPTLCDRSSVQAVGDSIDNGGSPIPVNNVGIKQEREHSQARNEGKESRRRLTQHESD